MQLSFTKVYCMQLLLNGPMFDTQGEAPIQIGQIISFIEHEVVVSSLNTSNTKVHILAHACTMVW